MKKINKTQIILLTIVTVSTLVFGLSYREITQPEIVVREPRKVVRITQENIEKCFTFDDCWELQNK